MLVCWPKDVNLNDLVAETLGENESWEKPEAYFIKLVEPKSLESRLKLWRWKEDYPEDYARATEFNNNITAKYDVIHNDPTFLKLLGYILGVGNVLNGGTNKGQADGFDLAVLGKVHSFRD